MCDGGGDQVLPRDGLNDLGSRLYRPAALPQAGVVARSDAVARQAHRQAPTGVLIGRPPRGAHRGGAGLEVVFAGRCHPECPTLPVHVACDLDLAGAALVAHPGGTRDGCVVARRGPRHAVDRGLRLGAETSHGRRAQQGRGRLHANALEARLCIAVVQPLEAHQPFHGGRLGLRHGQPGQAQGQGYQWPPARRRSGALRPFSCSHSPRRPRRCRPRSFPCWCKCAA